MRVVVTGTAGFVGSALSTRLLELGHEVVGIDCLLPDLYPAAVKRARLLRLLDRPGFSALDVDLRAESIAPALARADVVVHLAAMPGLTASWHDFGTYLDCNVRATKQVLDDLVRAPGAHLVHVSSSSVYGAVADGDESERCRPVSPYGVTKLAAEHLVASYRSELAVSASVLRYFSVCGPGQRPDMAYAMFCEQLLSRAPITITGDGHQTRSNTFIDDVVDATVLACEARPDGEVLNISGLEEISVLDAVSVLADELGVPAVVEHVAARAGDQRRTAGNSGRARQVLGWAPVTGIHEALRQQARHALVARGDAAVARPSGVVV